jgi:hypothetical protein
MSQGLTCRQLNHWQRVHRAQPDMMVARCDLPVRPQRDGTRDKALWGHDALGRQSVDNAADRIGGGDIVIWMRHH